jgi:mRNA interferase MazF
MSLWVNDMNAKELLLKEVDNIPEFILEEVWDFLQFLKVKYDKNKLESSLAEFVKGDVVVVPFPFSDLTQAKRRPALIIATLAGDDLILCQITSQRIADRYAITLESSDFSEGGLNQTSNIRPNRLFTADREIILYKAGKLKSEKLNEAIAKIVDIIQQ